MRTLTQTTLMATLVGSLLAGTAAQALDIVQETPPPQPLTAASAAQGQAQGQVQSTQPGQAGIAVSAWVDRQDVTYAIGQTLSMWVQTNQDAYVTVVSVDRASWNTADPIRRAGHTETIRDARWNAYS